MGGRQIRTIEQAGEPVTIFGQTLWLSTETTERLFDLWQKCSSAYEHSWNQSARSRHSDNMNAISDELELRGEL